jgi:hypothetical protein
VQELNRKSSLETHPILGGEREREAFRERESSVKSGEKNSMTKTNCEHRYQWRQCAV